MANNIIKDGDILNAMEMFIDYGPSVYGFNGHYYNLAPYQFISSENNVDLVSIEEDIDGKSGEIWMNGSLDTDRLTEEQVEYLKKALWLYNY